MTNSSKYLIASSFACILACIGDFVVLYVLGNYYPGYSQLKDTMSSLGVTNSPVSDQISTWWIIMGLLFMFFGTGILKAFPQRRELARMASLLIILYGLGEGIGSGAFKADHILNGLIFSTIIHNILGGIGVISILLLPIIMQKLIPKNEGIVFYRMSQIVFVIGILTILLFLFRYSSNENNFFSIYRGLWQRLFMLNSYIYLTTIAILIIRKQKTKIKGV